MKATAASAALVLCLALAASAAPAFAARSTYVFDDAHLLSQAAVSQLNQQIGDFNAQTGKEVVVVTTPSLNGTTPDAAVERSFAQQQVDGVEIFVAKDEQQIKIAGDAASRQFFPSGSFNAIYQAMRPSFQSGNFDQGVETGVSLIINTYRGHTSTLNGARRPAGAVAPARARTYGSGGPGLGFIWWIIIFAAIFFIIRGIFRALAGPRTYGGGYGPGGPGYGPGGPGYGGYGGYGGGGGFWSGLLGGLGGAWLGSELFGGRNFGGGNVVDGGNWAGTGADPGAAADAGGWQSDAGQIDTSNVGGGGWGDAGGGFGDSGGGGGWGGGGDFGGGGDSGGGW